MKLERISAVTVTEKKIADYLLDPAHPDNGGKADFFTKLGFQREHWNVLGRALSDLGKSGEVVSSAESPHGKKYVVVGRIQSPSGKMPQVKTVWIVDKGENAARLVTAYPHKS